MPVGWALPAASGGNPAHLAVPQVVGDQPHVDRPRAPVGDGRRHAGGQRGVRGQRQPQAFWRHRQREVDLHRVGGDPGEALGGK